MSKRKTQVQARVFLPIFGVGRPTHTLFTRFSMSTGPNETSGRIVDSQGGLSGLVEWKQGEMVGGTPDMAEREPR